MDEKQIRADERAKCARMARMVAERCPLPLHEGALMVEAELKEGG